MIKTAEQLMAEIGPEDVRTYPAVRRSWKLPAEPCLNADKGCQGNTKEKNCGRGWCRRCYGRWQRHGDSWYHKPEMKFCNRPDCFMKGTEGHP